MLTVVLLAVCAASLTAVVAAMLHARRVERRIRAQSHPLHELRGALSALRLGLQLIERSAVTGAAGPGRRARDPVEALRVQLDRAQSAIEQIDAFRTGVAARSSAAMTRFDLGEVVPERARMWAQLAPAYGASIRIDWRAGSAPVRGDRDRLTRALDNLICNALEHGGGRVSIEGERVRGRVRVTVRDRGAGVRPEIIQRAESDWSKARGHGLAIAREAIWEHDGTLAARGGLLGGRLVIDLPLADRLRAA